NVPGTTIPERERVAYSGTRVPADPIMLPALKRETEGPDPLPAPSGEAALLFRCARLLGLDEMERNGGLWRVRAREDAERLERVLNEIDAMKKTGVAIRDC